MKFLIRLIEPFDEIYQFAADMGGAGFVFTGENDADIMHNSVSINLNVLEEQRKLNETFTGEKGWSECNRPKLNWKTKIFYSGSACMYPEHNQLDPNNPDCRESSAYPATQTQNTDGRNYSPSVSTFLITVIIICLYALLDTIIFSGSRRNLERWKRKILPQQSVEKWRTQVLMIPSKSGEMVIKRDPSSTSTSVLRQPDDSWIPNSSNPVNIGSEEMVTINELVDIAAKVANKKIKKNHIDGTL